MPAKKTTRRQTAKKATAANPPPAETIATKAAAEARQGTRRGERFTLGDDAQPDELELRRQQNVAYETPSGLRIDPATNELIVDE